jgi:hypothetical protein
MTCEFTQVSVRRTVDPNEVNQRIAKELAEFRAAVKEGGFKSEVEKFCAGVTSEEVRTKIQAAKQKGAWVAARLEDIAQMCAQPTQARFERFLINSINADTKTCRVSVFQYDPVKYTRVNSRKWISNEGPKGSCNSVFLYTLEHEPKYDNLWNWTQTRIYADTTLKSCEGIEIGKKLEFAWNGLDFRPQLSCEYVYFSALPPPGISSPAHAR